MKYYKQEAGRKIPNILINDDDWNEAHDTHAWIGIMEDKDTNEQLEIWIEDKYVHDICTDTTITWCTENTNIFTTLPKTTIFFLKKQCALWRN